MQDFLTAFVLGVIEGITEFLPVSSTGHLILANQWIAFHNPLFTDAFNIVIQLGAVLAIVIVFWKNLFPFSQGITPQERQNVYQLWIKILVGFFPTGLIAFFLSDWVKESLFHPWVVAWALIFYGVLFLLVEKIPRKEQFNSIQTLNYSLVLAIGLIQSLALIPGTSRSGVTIIGAMLLGCTRVVATQYAFFLALPTIGSAALYSLYKYTKTSPQTLTGSESLVLLIGFITAFGTAWFVIKSFIRFISHHTFMPFGFYRIALGLVILTTFLF